MSTSYGDETVTIPAANGAAPTAPAPSDALFGLTPSQEARYALDLGLGPDHLKGDARTECDRLAKLREYRAEHPEAAPAEAKPVQAGDDPLSGLDPAAVSRARYEKAYGDDPENLDPAAREAYDRLAAAGWPQAG
jgi:hypothetical protein